VLADRAEGSRLSRTARLALASAAAALACGVVLSPALDAAGLLIDIFKLEDREVRLPLALISASLTVNVFIDVAIAFATFEMLLRRQAAQRALDASVAEQAALSRKVLQSRLAAMQAQVEPRFLFDTLVGIEQLYARDAAQGAAQMDRLIAYLRVALPRLRESGSTVAAEAELVQSYLAVVQASAGGRPQLRVTVAGDCAGAPLHPMLLPMVQRAVRDPAQVPAAIDLVAKRSGDAVTIVLRLARGGLCDGDDELHRVQGRLAALYGPQAQLHCDASMADATEFTLHLPAPSAA
jgi:LytS/YehU family sensor histidine kinase